FNTIDQLAQLSDGGGVIATFDWAGGDSRLIKCSIPSSGVTHSFLNAGNTQISGYDSIRRPVEERISGPGNSTVTHRMYAYNRASVRTLERRLDDDGQEDTYVYDSLYRVAQTNLDQGGTGAAPKRNTETINYLLDGVGNRRSVGSLDRQGGTTQEVYSINEVNEYTEVGEIARLHDANGNLSSDGSRIFAYDYKNRLVQVSLPSGPVALATYTYDCTNRRTRKTVRDENTGVVQEDVEYLFDGDDVCEERSGGTIWATYVCHPALGVDMPVQVQRSASHPDGVGTSYIHQNVRGDVVALTSGAGVVEEKRFYDDFGRAFDAAKQAISNLLHGVEYGFRGRRLDPETALYFFRNRTYDAATGRFLQRDSIWDTGNVGNQYTFGGSSPVSSGDPMGTCMLGDLADGLRDAMSWLGRGSPFEDGINRGVDTYDMVKESGGNPVEAVLLAAADTFLEATGVNDLYAGASGTNYNDYIRGKELKQLTNQERAAKLASGALQLAGSLTGGAGALSKGKCVLSKGPGSCFEPDTPVATSTGLVSIDTVQVGDRVLAEESWAPEEEIFSPDTHVVGVIELECADGSLLEATLLRTKEWFAHQRDPQSGLIGVSFEEVGEAGWARVLRYEPCPRITSGTGRVVTATFRLTAKSLGSVWVEGGAESERIRVTGEHRFFSSTRGWTHASDLRPGEPLRSLEHTVKVASRKPFSEEGVVCNLEVEGSHSYYVGRTRVLVHNANYFELTTSQKKSIGAKFGAYRKQVGAENALSYKQYAQRAAARMGPLKGKKTYQTYTKPHPTKPDYVGRTSGKGTPSKNVRNRDRGHHMTDKGFGPARPDKSHGKPGPIRGREQMGVEGKGGAQSMGGTSSNAINGIGPNNPKKKGYIDAAREAFGGWK
ncbi:MAG: hypothetical protein JKY65_15190, partial [Planctomycetes bacterium]|nr:hypothetical protein [Planctomycetota bacterium]